MQYREGEILATLRESATDSSTCDTSGEVQQEAYTSRAAASRAQRQWADLWRRTPFLRYADSSQTPTSARHFCPPEMVAATMSDSIPSHMHTDLPARQAPSHPLAPIERLPATVGGEHASRKVRSSIAARTVEPSRADLACSATRIEPSPCAEHDRSSLQDLNRVIPNGQRLSQKRWEDDCRSQQSVRSAAMMSLESPPP